MTIFYVLRKVDIFLNEGGQKFLEALLGWTLPPCLHGRACNLAHIPACSHVFSIMRVVNDQVQLHTAQECPQTLCEVMQPIFTSRQ